MDGRRGAVLVGRWIGGVVMAVTVTVTVTVTMTDADVSPCVNTNTAR